MPDHPSRAELAALKRHELAPERERQIILHLLSPCESCLAQLPAPLGLLLGYAPARAVPSEADYDAALQRVFSRVTREARHVQREKKKAKAALAVLSAGGLEAVDKLPPDLSPLAKMEACLARSWDLRYDNHGLMIQFAKLAEWASRGLDACVYGAPRVADYRCRALAELGNAYRVGDQFGLAETKLAEARRQFVLGTGDPLLEARLLELEASLDADLRRFGMSCHKLEKVHRYYLERGNRQLAGKSRIKQGLYTSNSGDAAEGLRLLRESLDLIAGDPSLEYAARHNLVWILLDGSRFKEAEREVFLLRAVQPHEGGRINELRRRWMEGRIDAGLDRLDRAEATLSQVEKGFQRLRRAYDAALCSLDLIAVLLGRNRPEAASNAAVAAHVTFMALGIDREGLQALLALLIALQMNAATRAMAEEVAAFLRRLDNDPTARFEGRSWRFDG